MEGSHEPELKRLGADFAPKRSDRETVMYRVGGGDTLIGIGQSSSPSTSTIWPATTGSDPEDQLREGALLKIMVKRRVLDDWRRKASSFEKSVRRRRKKSDHAG